MCRPLGALALFTLAFAVNASTFDVVFTEGGVSFPTGTDELYHMRRIWYDTVHFPDHLDFDPYANFPHGSRSIWPFLLDWLAAGVARVLVGAGDQAAVERLVVWLPPLLGAANAVAIAGLGAALSGWRAGWLAGLLLALLPAHAHNARLGMIDHHVALVLASIWLMSCVVRSFRPGPGMRPLSRAAETSLALVVGMLVSPTFLFQVLVVQGIALGVLWFSSDPATATARARFLALTHALAAALIAPFCIGQSWPQLGSLSPVVLSDFQPLWLALGAAVLAVLPALWSVPRAGATPARRRASMLALGVACLALLLWAFPGPLREAFGASRWFAKSDEFMHLVDESLPLLYPQGVFAPGLASQMLSWGVWAFPLAWLWVAFRRGREAPHAFLLTWAAVFGVATLVQHRFADQFAVGFVLVLAAALHELARTRFRGVLVPASVAALAVGLLPCRDYYVGEARVRYGEDVIEAARWIRRATPPTAGYLDASERPEYGILGAWNDGHRLRYYAERPVVQDNFGVHGNFGAPPAARGFELAREYYRARDEEHAYAIARQLRARYVVVSPSGSGHDLVITRGTLVARLRRWLGSDPPPRVRERRAALGRHRLVHVRGRGEERVAVFEIVPGAVVSGSAPPGRDVHVELRLRGENGASLPYRATTSASARGRYEIRLPYATEAMPHSDLQSEGPYRVRCGTATAELELSEADVQEGRSRPGPSCREAAGGSTGAATAASAPSPRTRSSGALR